MEEQDADEEQYKQVCGASGCDCVLGINVVIFCITKGDEEMTVCGDCGQDMMKDGWVDTNRGSSDEEQDPPQKNKAE